ncbi:lipase [Ganoderma leucocontextum]|nr:lipase [Ganoderma leucocontextum]
MSRSLKVGFSTAVAGALLAAQAAAFPTAVKRQTALITALSPAQITAFRPYTHYASTGYCSPASTLAWDCGANCKANPSFEPVASGGDGDLTQFWYVGFDSTLKEVIVSHQGTDTSELLPILTDGDIILEKLDKKLFPGVSTSVEVHSGFAGTQSRSAPGVLAAVQKAITKFRTNKVTVAGHSLGAAIGLLDAVYLPLHIPNITTRFVGYGLPRVGNQHFADYVDAQRSISVTHVNNKKDIVPILPGRFLGFHHPSGEVHIEESGAWLACPGQDNTDARCTVGDVPNIFVGNGTDHDGPYDGIEMGC